MDARDAAREATDAAAAKLGSFIRQQRTAAQLSLRKLARMADVSDPYLSQIERGLRKPSADILQRLAEALRISAESLYYQAGILTEPDGDLRARIRAERGLSESQKRALIEVYESFLAHDERPPSASEGAARGDEPRASGHDEPQGEPQDQPQGPRAEPQGGPRAEPQGGPRAEPQGEPRAEPQEE